MNSMSTIRIEHDVKVFGFQVKTFPQGIGEAFDSLVNSLPRELQRSYYGISYMTPAGIKYFATAEERFKGEVERYHERYQYETFNIESGEYLAVMISDWQSKTNTIKDVFADMLQYDCQDGSNRPCVEWYKNDDEMFCMVRQTSTHAKVK